VRPKVSVGPNDKEVNVLHFGLASLLEKHKAYNVGDRKKIPQKLQQKREVNTKGHEVLFFEGVPEPGHFRGSGV